MVVNGVSQGPITTYTFTNVTANGTIVATFKLKPFVITPTAGAHGTITPGTPQTVLYGGSATFTIAADPGYSIVDVLVDGVSVGAIASYTFSNVTANHTIAATFTTDLRDHADGGCGRHDHAGHAAVREQRRQRHLHDRAEHGLQDPDVKVDGVSNRAAITQLHLQQRDGEPHHRGHLRDPDLHDHADGGCGRHDHAGHEQTVDYDGSATFTITPNTGYRILDVLVDGVSNPAP